MTNFSGILVATIVFPYIVDLESPEATKKAPCSVNRALFQ